MEVSVLDCMIRLSKLREGFTFAIHKKQAMDVEWVRKECLTLPMTTEDMPFGDDIVAFRLHGKIFCLLSLNTADRMNLKADPDQAVTWRTAYPQVQPGYHMNKRHWNTVILEGMSERLLRKMIHHSFECVKTSLSRKLQLETDLYQS